MMRLLDQEKAASALLQNRDDDWGLGELTVQDQLYIELTNGLIDIATTGFDFTYERNLKRLQDLFDYFMAFPPEGFNERLEKFKIKEQDYE